MQCGENMPPDAHPSLSRSLSAENRRLPASRTQNARSLPPLPENVSALHRWKCPPLHPQTTHSARFFLAYSVQKICRQTPIHLSRGQYPPKTAACLQAGRKTRARLLRCLKTPPRSTVGKSFPFAPDGNAKALFYFPRALAHNRHRGKQHRLPWRAFPTGSGAVSAANTLRSGALRSTQRFQMRTATRSMPSCPATCRAMAQNRLCLSTRRVCVQTPKEACALGGTLPPYIISLRHRRVNAPLPKPRRL